VETKIEVSPPRESHATHFRDDFIKLHSVEAEYDLLKSITIGQVGIKGIIRARTKSREDDPNLLKIDGNNFGYVTLSQKVPTEI
jgi:hypothetical protein